MTFEEALAQVVEGLRRERRVSYRALRRRCGLDAEYLEDLKAEIIQTKKTAMISAQYGPRSPGRS